jgi:hypothetical protein
VSLQDLAWVIAAAEDVADHGGRLDEERVNRLRYLEGTPKESTRWIDTGWALAAWDLGKQLVRDSIAVEDAVVKLRRDNGEVIDASFRVKAMGDQQSVVYESRGGTTGGSDARNVDYAEGLELVLRDPSATPG